MLSKLLFDKLHSIFSVLKGAILEREYQSKHRNEAKICSKIYLCIHRCKMNR